MNQPLSSGEHTCQISTKVTQRVIRGEMSAESFAKLGYKRLEDISFERDEDTPNGLSIAAMEYESKEEYCYAAQKCHAAQQFSDMFKDVG